LTQTKNWSAFLDRIASYKDKKTRASGLGGTAISDSGSTEATGATLNRIKGR